MSKNRLEAFSDGVIAILITIMVLELHLPHEPTWQALEGMLPGFLSYVLSYVFLGIYWNNHHHMLHTAERVNGKILWANMHLLFWLSLVPFTTAWMGEQRVAPLPTALYGVVLLCSGVGYLILQHAIIAEHGPDSRLAKALRKDVKGPASAALYSIAVPLAFYRTWASCAIYAAVALMWLIPDRRIESRTHDV
jgi:uncharacterized membrane protein